jgi:NAD(P)-dependent dehydrogenase (short-subunit alcohol dehydrogenase family)
MTETPIRKNTIAVVTGGGTGIGRAVVEALAADGYRCVALGLDADDDLPASVEFHRVDVTDTTACLAAIPEGPISALVNCAGVLRHADEWQADTFDFVMKVNVTAGFALANALAARLEAAGGAVVNVASMWAIFGSPGAPAYTASKGAVAALTRSQAVAWAQRGIRVNSIAPGWVETRISEKARTDATRAPAILARIPMRRWAKPSEIAGVVQFLLSPAAGYITGTMIPVDGGFSIA